MKQREATSASFAVFLIKNKPKDTKEVNVSELMVLMIISSERKMIAKQPVGEEISSSIGCFFEAETFFIRRNTKK